MRPVDETAETLEADATPLNEEEEAPQASYATQMPANTPTHRRLQAIAGAGVPYVFMTFVEETEQVTLDFWGVQPDELAHALTAVAQAVTR